MKSRSTPNVSRRELARLLRELRQLSGLSLDQVHHETGLDAGFVSRVERALRGLGDDNAAALANLYRASPEIAARVRQLASEARQSTWWDRSDVPKPIKDYIGFEQAASAISIYGSLIPGLLQTRAYAEAVVKATDLGRPIESQALVVEQRLRRQEVLQDPNGPWVNVILDEAAIRRKIGGTEIFRQQIHALIAAAERPRTTVRLVSFSVGAHAGIDSRFVMISTSDDFKIDFVHVEGLSGYRNFQRPQDLGNFIEAWTMLASIAQPPADTLITLAKVASVEEVLPTASDMSPAPPDRTRLP